MEVMEKGEVKNPLLTNSKKSSAPRISIYVDNGQENIEYENSTRIIDDETNITKSSDENMSTKMMKCHSMQNMRSPVVTSTSGSTNMENDRYKQNLSQFNSNYYYCAANQMIPVKTDAVRLKHGAAYRKCLSRVNLNLYQNNSNVCSPSATIVHSNSQQENDVAAARVLVNPKIVKINPNRYSKVIIGFE